MKRLLALVLTLLLAGCGGGSSNGSSNGSSGGSGSQNPPQIAGSWEFLATSSQSPGYATLIETNLQQSGGNLSAAGTAQIVALGKQPSGAITIGGNCPGNDVDSASGTISSSKAITLTLNEGGNVFDATGNYAASSPPTMTGTYNSTSSACPDSGTFTGYIAAPLSGAYAGLMLLPDGSTDNAVATLSEASSASLSINFVVSGFDNGSFTLTGFVVANTFAVQGEIFGFPVMIAGYYNPTAKTVELAAYANGVYTPVADLSYQ